jgi:cytochrome c-type biogenesis protein CcmH/NrfG
VDSSRAKQLSRTAWALAILFGSLPLVSRVLLGVWTFEGAAGIAILLVMLGAYFHFRGWRHLRTIPDYATLLDRANRKAREGTNEAAIALLTKAIRLNPRLWQAFQYRGELYLWLQNSTAALADFAEAIRLAPKEPHLFMLRAEAYRHLGDEASATKDCEAASELRQIES